MIYSILFSSIVPLIFLVLIRRLDFFETEKPGLIVVALAWGAVAVSLSYYVAHPLVPIFGRPLVSMRISPFVEEIFKSLILFYLLSRADLYFVSGAIYGFAVGIGFAVAENMLYLSRLDVDTGVIVATTRAFSCIMHGGSTALVGIALAGFPLTRKMQPIWAWLCGLSIAIAIHLTYNFLAFQNLGQSSVPVLISAAFFGPLLVVVLILWGLRRERAQMHEALGLQVGVSEQEAVLVQHMDDLDRLLLPIERRFGKHKRKLVADLLRVEAELGVKEELLQRAVDPQARAQLAAEIAKLEQQIDRLRRDLGVYVMLYVRSIFPQTAWSLWARLAQALAQQASGRSEVWRALHGRLGAKNRGGEGMYARIAAELDVRAQATAPPAHQVRELPAAMQKGLSWAMQQLHLTSAHMAAALGHTEVQAREMLSELVKRGFLHSSSRDGQATYQAHPPDSAKLSKRPHIWQLAAFRNQPGRKGIRQ